MNSHYQKETGILILIPTNELDKRLIYHLMNCADLSQFNKYLRHQALETYPMTVDIGIPYEQYDELHFDGRPNSGQRDVDCIDCRNRGNRVIGYL
jgi:hypothetical protein